MVHTETVKIGEVGAIVDPSLAPSGVVNASIVEREIGVPSLVLEVVNNGGVTGGGAIDPLLPPEGVARVVGERIISEPTMPTSGLDPPQSKETIGTAPAAHASTTSKDLC